MTAYKPYSPYNSNKDTRPLTVSIGCEIATRAQEHYDMGNGEVAYVPIKTKIVFLDVSRDIVSTKKGGCDYNTVAALLQQKGYSRAMWTIKSIWVCQDDTDIF